MNQQSLKAEDAKNKEVEQLQKQIDELKKPSAATTATTATADPTATWNTYSNANYGFSIKYLPSYAYRESTATPFSISFQKADDKSLEPFGYGMTVYSIAPMTLNNWVDTVKAKEGEPSVGSGSLKECKVNGNNGFCYSSSGMLGAFNNYLVQSKDGKYAIELALPKEGNLGFSVDNLLSSFKLL
jgi:hypothetical protein